MYERIFGILTHKTLSTGFALKVPSLSYFKCKIETLGAKPVETKELI